MSICRLTVAAIVLTLSSVLCTAGDLYWDTDASAPLVGSGVTENLGGSFFSTAAGGDTALTTIGTTTNDVFFQADTNRSYTIHVDTNQSVGTLTVANSNDVTLTTSDSSAITCTNKIVVQGGSSLTFHHLGNARVLNSSVRPAIELGAGDNTFTIRGSSSSTAYWISGISGDAGDRIGVTNSSHWVVNTVASVFGGELFGPWRLSPGTMTLTGDSDDFTGKIEGGTVTLGDGGTSGSIGSATRQLGALKFNRSDDLTFTNTILGASQTQIHNIGTGAVTINSGFSSAQHRFYGDRGTVRGDLTISQFLWVQTSGTWVLAGSNTITSTWAAPIIVSDGGTLQIGDGTTSASLTMISDVDKKAQFRDPSNLAMDIRGGALLAIDGALEAGPGRHLKIIGGGQKAPIITYGGTLTPFENVIYNGVTNTWAEAQVSRALGGLTQMRIDGSSIYIDPLPPAGTVISIE